MVMALQVEGAVAGYGDRKILTGLSLQVPEGSVYALLGPSGCGKTTLLSCVLGRKSLDGGSVRVLGGRPGDRSLGLPGTLVGYMPQSTSLFMEFTINETFSYFGRLLHMPAEQISTRREKLLELLDLPTEDREVRTLSGGQQRRLSFAMALIHHPRILILDEPTVGVDPLVRQKVWEHLLELARVRGTTTIITTHYVEEARGAARVGFMRDGRLLAEDSPAGLLATHGVSSLEGVFLALCQTEERFGVVVNSSSTVSSMASITHSQGNLISKAEDEPDPGPDWSCSIPSMSNIAALLIKNWITMKRNPVLLIFIFFLPGIFMVLTCISIGIDPKDLPIGVINLETNCSDVALMENCEADMLSCYYLDSLNRTEAVSLVEYQDEAAMARDAASGVLRGSLLVPSQFSHSFLKRLLKPDMYDEWTYYYDIDDSIPINKTEKMALGVDTSDTLVALVMRQAVADALNLFGDIVNLACKEELEGESLDLRVVAEQGPTLGREGSTYQEYIVPAFLTQVIYFLAMSLTSESFISERAQGLLERSWLMGVLPLEILTSYILSQFLVIVMQVAIALIVVFGVFQIPCSGNMGLFILLSLLQGLVGMSYGFFLSTICNTTAEAMKLAISSFFPVILLCGFVWPIEGMPYPWLRQAVWYLPQTAGMQGLRDISLRGWGLLSPAVYQGIIISSSWTLLFLGLSWILVRNKL